MNPAEDALIRRIDARRAFAKVLRGQNGRNRAILVAAWREGSTFREIGQRLGLSSARIGQIHAIAFDHVQAVLKQRTLSATSLHGAPPGFDKAEFLDHMRRLIRRRDEEREEARKLSWQREKEVMSHFLKMATPEPPPRQPVAPPPPPIFYDVPRTWPVYGLQNNVEPWFDPSREPTPSDLLEITKYAVGYYAAALRVPHPGLEPPRKVLFSFECARDADIIAGGLYQRRKDFPVAQARFTGIRVTIVGTNVMLEIGFA